MWTWLNIGARITAHGLQFKALIYGIRLQPDIRFKADNFPNKMPGPFLGPGFVFED
jgi:hypothetical protein